METLDQDLIAGSRPIRPLRNRVPFIPTESIKFGSGGTEEIILKTGAFLQDV